MDKKQATHLHIDDCPELRSNLLIVLDQFSREQAVQFATKAICDFAIEPSYYSFPVIDEIKNTVAAYQNGNVKIGRMRNLSLKIHNLARNSPHPLTRAYYRAWGHALASAHVSTHAIIATDYLVYIVNLTAPNNNSAVKALRTHQLTIINTIKSSQ